MTELSETVAVAAEPRRRSVAWMRWAPLLLACIVAAAVRILLLQDERVVWGDEPFYLWLGRNWITGRGFAFTGHADVHHGPLFPWLAGLLYLLTGDLALASEVLYVAFGALLLLPLYGLGKELYDRRVGLAAAGVAAVFPALTAGVLHWGTMTEAIYMVFVYLGLLAGAVALRPVLSPGEGSGGGRREPLWAYPLAGLAYGLAYLTRPEAITYLGVGVVLLVLLRALGRQLGSARFWLGLFLFILTFAVAFVPYAYYVRLNTGSWMVSEKVGVTYLTCLGLVRGDTAAFDRATWGLDSTGLETFFFSPESYDVSMLDLILADPRSFLAILYMNAIGFIKVLIGWTLFPYVLLPLVALGLFRQGWTRQRALGEIYLLGAFIPVLAFVMFFIQARYLVAVMPVMILWAALGLMALSDWLIGTIVALRTPENEAGADGGLRAYWHMPQGWRILLEVLPMVVLMGALLASYPAVLQEVQSVGSFRPAHRTLGELLAEKLPAEAIVMSRYPAIAFHAGTEWAPTPNASLSEVLTYARHKGVNYFVIDERELRYRPSLTPLVTGEQVPQELAFVFAIREGGERLVAYQFVGQ